MSLLSVQYISLGFCIPYLFYQYDIYPLVFEYQVSFIRMIYIPLYLNTMSLLSVQYISLGFCIPCLFYQYDIYPLVSTLFTLQCTFTGSYGQYMSLCLYIPCLFYQYNIHPLVSEYHVSFISIIYIPWSLHTMSLL